MSANRDNIQLGEELRRLAGLQCWNVNAGGAVGTSFSLAFGKRVPRRIPLKNPAISEEFRLFEGEANLYVWCTWRLETEEAAVASSEQDGEDAADEIRKLEGLVLSSIQVSDRAHDLTLGFGGLTLRVFCDRVGSAGSSEANWELFLQGRSLHVGPGFDVDEECEPTFL